MLQEIATVITAVGVLLGVLSLRASRRQRLRQFEAFYIARYWQIMDRLSLHAMRGQGTGDPGKVDEEAVRAYIRLCEDQCELRTHGWISDETWKLWSEGIVLQFQKWPFDVVWSRVRERKEEYKYLKAMIDMEKEIPKPSIWSRTKRGV